MLLLYKYFLTVKLFGSDESGAISVLSYVYINRDLNYINLAVEAGVAEHIC